MNDDINDMIDDELSDPLGYAPPEEEEAAAIPLPNEPPFRITKGKYQGLTLPRMLGVKPSMLDKVEAMKREIIADPEFHRHASSLSQTYAELRREAEAKKDELNEIKIRLTACMLMMVDQFEAESTTQLTHSDKTTIRVQAEPHLIVIDKPNFRLACIDAGLESLMSLPWATANKLMKERALEALEPFEGGQLYMRPKVFFSDGLKVGKK